MPGMTGIELMRRLRELGCGDWPIVVISGHADVAMAMDAMRGGAVDFLERKAAEGAPIFLWVNTTHMHFRTHTKPESRGQAGRWQSEYHDTMIDHDRHVGRVLDTLDALGLADDTIVIYSTDNGPHMNSWPARAPNT